MDKQKILMVIGSLRRQSLNRQLAEAGAELLKDQAEVSVLDYTRLPFINPDMEFPVPDEVQKIRDRISGADGVWIFFPEYNYSYPGALKNLLDWISRPTAQGAPRTCHIPHPVSGVLAWQATHREVQLGDGHKRIACRRIGRTVEDRRTRPHQIRVLSFMKYLLL